MLPRCLFSFLSYAFLATASVLPASYASSDAHDLNSTTTPVVLQPDDVIMVGRGRIKVMKEVEYRALVRRRDDLFRKHGEDLHRRNELIQNVAKTFNAAAEQPQQSAFEERGCEQSFELQVLDQSNFTGPDVPMSAVIQATGAQLGPTNTVGVAAGYSIANTVTIGATAAIGAPGAPGFGIFSVLQLSFNIQKSRTWTSSYTATYTFAVSPNYYGLVVSNPWTHRLSGNVLFGCTDSWLPQIFQSDSFSSGAFDNLDWVQGVIKLCQSPHYPVPFCEGDGFHH